jgi:hypothetical protein
MWSPFLQTANYGIAMVSISAIDVFFSGYPKSLDLIFIYLSGLMISIGNLRILKRASVEDK